MALALSEFDALCGFCPMEELQAALREVPELAECVGEPHTSALCAAREPDAQVGGREQVGRKLWTVEVTLMMPIHGT